MVNSNFPIVQYVVKRMGYKNLNAQVAIRDAVEILYTAVPMDEKSLLDATRKIEEAIVLERDD